MSIISKIGVENGLSALRKNQKEFILIFTHGTLEVEIYKPEIVDKQQPHERDEVYIIISGEGKFYKEGEVVEIVAGDFLFVEAGKEHRFFDFSEDFSTWVIFYGPKGGESNNNDQILKYMQDKVFNNIPKQYDVILDATKALAFDMASDLQTGSLLSALVASKPNANILEMGTGTGLSTSWILSGMDNKSRLTTIENNGLLLNIAKKNLISDKVDFVLADGYEWLKNYTGEKFDLIFADAMPGKYDLFEEAFDLLKPGGIYFIDDMLPQPNWPEGHEERVNTFIEMLDHKTDVTLTKLNWSTGIIIVVKNI